MKRNYPKNRKLPEHSEKAVLLKRYSLEEIEKTFVELGMYKTAEKMEVNPGVIHYMAIRNGWKRPLPDHLITAMNRGNWNTIVTNIKPTNNHAN